MSDAVRSRTPWVVGGVVLGALIAAVLVWFLSGSEPAAVDLRSDAVSEGAADEAEEAPEGQPPDEAEAGGDVATDGADDRETSGTAGDPATVESDGIWQVDTAAVAFDRAAGTGSFVGYRVDEELSGIGATTAVGRTPAVEGSVTVEGGVVTATEVVADLTQLTSDDSRRDGRVSSMLSSTSTASFVLTESIERVRLTGEGDVSEATATGELTIEGATNLVEVELQAARREGLVVVAGSVSILLSDFGLEAPSAPIVLSVSDEAIVEWQLYLAPSAP